jgi:hypothetical protein
MQTGMYACGALLPPEAQISGLERHQNPVSCSRKTVQVVRDEGEKEVKVKIPQALAVGVCQKHKIFIHMIEPCLNNHI